MAKPETTCNAFYIETDTLVSPIAGKLFAVVFHDASASITLYDSVDTSGPVVAKIVNGAAEINKEQLFHKTPVWCSTALWAEISGTGAGATIYFIEDVTTTKALAAGYGVGGYGERGYGG